ncbi:MAG: class I SAM-dependent methyltransferase [Rhodomicrobium sp.]
MPDNRTELPQPQLAAGSSRAAGPKTLVQYIDRALYPGIVSNWDDDLLRSQILALLRPEFVILDLGAGAGILPQMNFRGLASRVCGVDLDPRVTSNPMLDEGKVANAGGIPYAGAMFDLVFADNVLEHLEDPLTVFCEIARVLKPGGRFVFKTPNKWHYVPTIARITPHRFHQAFNRLRGRAEADTFPTVYRANTRPNVSALARAAGLKVERLEVFESRPEYLRLTAATYLAGALYERAVNSTKALEGFRVALTGTLAKPAQLNTQP